MNRYKYYLQEIEVWQRLIGIVIVLALIVFLESFIDPGERSLDDVMRWIFGSVGFGSRNQFFSSLLRFLLPQMGMLLLWGNDLYENVVKNYELIFTRTRKSSKVLWKYVIQLAVRVTIAVVLLEAMLFVVYYLKGSRVDSVMDLCLDLVLYCIFTDCLVVMVNIVSLAVKSTYSVIIVLAIQLLLLEETYHLLQGGDVPGLYYILPTSPAMLVQNTNLGQGIKIMWGIYLTGIMALCFILGCQYTSHKEYY